MKILVTGAGGFVGRQTCADLLAHGHEVYCAQQYLKEVPEGCLARVVGRLDCNTNWSGLLKDVGAVIHLAARVHIMKDTAADSLAAFREVNVEGTRKLAIDAAAAGVKRFIFVSSIKVNGISTDRGKKRAKDRGVAAIPRKKISCFTEQDVVNPQDPYSISKWEAEVALSKISADTGMEVVTLRPPLLYGPGVKANFLKLMQLVDSGIPLPFGGIKNERSLLGVSNLSDLICNCTDDPRAAGETFVVSDNEDVSTPELAKRISRALEKKSRLISVPESMFRLIGYITGKSFYIQRLCSSLKIDSSYVRETLDWNPPFRMDQELARVAEWYKNDRRKHR